MAGENLLFDVMVITQMSQKYGGRVKHFLTTWTRHFRVEDGVIMCLLGVVSR